MKRSLAIVFSVVAATLGLALPGLAQAYESDVHFGLTRWLALRAGFGESQADALATADQRVDGDRIETLQLGIEFACAEGLPEVARQVQSDHYPSAAAVPAAPAHRAVLAGSDAARAALVALRGTLIVKEGLMLGKFGAALHPLQDSWAHQGIASELRMGASLRCDAALAFAHPAARGGPASHAADASAAWPADALAMARSTYDELVRYPAIGGQMRKAAPWESLLPALQGFVKGTTKTQKRAWFLAQGMQDTSFLGGTSLPDGADPGPLEWSGRKFLALPGNASMQHDAPADARAFVDRLLARWLGAERIEGVVAEMAGLSAGAKPSAASPWPSARELAARLKLWKVRDHGSAAELVHAPSPLGAAQLRAADRLTSDLRALIAPTEVSQAFYSLQPATQAPMPLLPYILRALPESGGGQKMVAIAKLRHAPYDSIGWVIERRENGWALIDVVASIHP